jgi:hypothetical protein
MIPVPRGSDYRGPAEALDLYATVVDSSAGESALKGAKNPYTARNGHMFSFLDIDGMMALRLPDDLRDEFLARYESGPVVQYGSVMRGYVSVPADLLRKTDELRDWLEKSYDWIGTLEPKPTQK